MDDKILYYIWLSCTLSPGSKTPKLLLRHFDSISEIYSATKKDYEDAGVSKYEIPALCNKSLELAKHHYDYCVKNNVAFLCFEDSYYPERLKIIENPPPLFYYKGRLSLLDDYPCITMVGTRSCSERGFRLAYNIGYDAASKGAVIVNGLALGIDGACIAGALDANGYAVGLLGCGIDRIYPYGNKDLFERLFASGLVMTEFAPFTEPAGKNFPVRNRVMSALSVATAVFEAADGSGAMITAKHASEQGRRIFAVPGKPYDKTYAGSLELIKDGATVFTEADDILTEYAMSFPHRINLANINTPPSDKLDSLVARYFKKDTDPDAPVNRRFSKKTAANTNTDARGVAKTVEKAEHKVQQAFIQTDSTETKTQTDNNSTTHDLSLLSVTEKQIYDIICNSNGISPDEIAEQGMKIDDILSTLTLLEIYGLIKALPGGKYHANK